ncbi:MAG: helix-turn-helix transcriptional regulator [Cyanobacteria bacterium J06642_11]
MLDELPKSATTAISQPLWRCCKALLESREGASDLFPDDYTIVLEDEISTANGTIHARVQWFDWNNAAYQATDCFLITLEDKQQSLTAMASQEAQRYGLTSRETDVWQLKRMGYSYKEISKKLFISENTVKKHLKNIYAKKELVSL